MTFDRKRLAQLADWEAVAVAILLVVWLITLIPTLNTELLWREIKSAAGGLPVLLWLLGAIGMLWADVSWSERGPASSPIRFKW
jgi:protein-S-isoprenylcysteine O-methyltransferase Ste14